MGSVFTKGEDSGGNRRVVSAQDDDDEELGGFVKNGHGNIDLKVLTESDSNFDREAETCVGMIAEGQLARVQVGNAEIIFLPNGEVYVKN